MEAIRLMKDRNWYAMYTRFKSEKIAQAYYSKTGIEAYVPTIRKTKRYTRKIKHYNIPLISCYVFVKISCDEKVKALKNPYVIHFLKIGSESATIPDSEIQILRKIAGEINEVEVMTAEQYNLGDEVEVIGGNLTGLKGRIIEHKGKKDLLIELSHIGIQLKIQIDSAQLRRIRSALSKPRSIEAQY